jgi:hypothetical protein
VYEFVHAATLQFVALVPPKLVYTCPLAAFVHEAVEQVAVMDQPEVQ